jgi:pimeloyl-ACP methyl ester carboxylesterase
MAAYADDPWLCAELELNKPVIVGNSMGGNVALELAAHYPEIPASIMMIDSVVFPSRELREALQPAVEGLLGPDFVAFCQSILRSVCLPTDEEPQKTELLSALPKAPRHVLASSFRNHVLEYESAPAAEGCHVPIAYVGATVSLADLPRFRNLTPQLVTAQTLGVGHFSQLFVPEQINEMITHFVTVYSSSDRSDGIKK